MFTYQDFLDEPIPAKAVQRAISEWIGGDIYRTAVVADKYDHQKNETIMSYVQKIYTLSGSPIEDLTASNNRICSNLFHRLNTQRCVYSLGNGVTFPKDKNGRTATKDKFGARFDNVLIDAGYYSLIHGVSFLYYNKAVYSFKATEFAPVYDEYSGELKAGVQFWQLAADKPMLAVLYEEDGYTKFMKGGETKADGIKSDAGFVEVKPKSPYVVKVQTSEADGEEVIGGENYSSLPIVPLWGSKLKQSTLIGMQSAIDSYDLIRSGFANDLSDCAQIYWILENYGGMTDADLARFRDHMKLAHIAEMNTEDGGKITPYAQDIPYQARKEYLDMIRAGIYEDFGGLDVHTIAAGATNDHIDAAYQPMDENADDFEAQVIKAVMQLGKVIGIPEDDAVPLFKRNRISNQAEQVQMVVQEAAWLDEETILSKLPNVTVDEIQEIQKRKETEDQERMPTTTTQESNFGNETEEEESGIING